MFEQLHQSATGSVNKLSKSNISLASLCSNLDPKKKRNTDVVGVTASICSTDQGKSCLCFCEACGMLTCARGSVSLQRLFC